MFLFSQNQITIQQDILRFYDKSINHKVTVESKIFNSLKGVNGLDTYQTAEKLKYANVIICASGYIKGLLIDTSLLFEVQGIFTEIALNNGSGTNIFVNGLMFDNTDMQPITIDVPLVLHATVFKFD